MRILHVITSLQYGGAEKLVADIVPMLKNKGNDIDVVAFDNSEPNFSKLLDEKGIKVIFFGKGYYSLRFLFRLGKMMKDYDIVHTHNTSPQYFAALGSYFCKVKLITTEHSTSNRRRDKKYFKFIDRWMYNRYKAVICISEKTKTNLQEHLGNVKVSLIVINNGINVDKFKKAYPLTDKDKGTNKFVITMVAGFRYQKDQETLIKAFNFLDANKFELWLVGDGEKRCEIEKHIEEYNLRNIRLWGNRSDIPSILKSSDIVVQSSHIEGFGLAAVEGMAAGKPVIATDIPGLSQVVKGAGLLVPHKDDTILATEIIRLYEDKDYYLQIANKCNQRAQMFDIKEMVNGYQKVYEEVMNAK